MLKEKLQAAVEDLKKTFSGVRAQPGTGGAIDLTLDLNSAALAHSECEQALGILTAHGLKAHGFVATRHCSKIFLRNVSEIQPAACPPPATPHPSPDTRHPSPNTPHSTPDTGGHHGA